MYRFYHSQFSLDKVYKSAPRDLDMAKDKGISLPSSGGLTNFGKEVSSKILLSPKVVIVIIVLVVLFEYFLHKFGANLL